MKRILKKLTFISLCMCSYLAAHAGNDGRFTDTLVSVEDSATGLAEKRKFKGLRVSGYARTFFFYRNLNEIYDLGDQGRLTMPQNYSLGDGYDEPLVYLEMQASPFPATLITTQLSFDNRLLRGGSFNETVDDDGRMVAPWYNFNFMAETNTDVGSFKLIAGGGVNWYHLSPFTFWSANDYSTRDNMFDRVPWESQGNDFDRYMNYYEKSGIVEERGWGNAASQGVVLEGAGLPGNVKASILVGKSSGSDGFQSYETKRPMMLVAARLERTFGKQNLGLNFVNQYGHMSNEIEYAEIEKDGEIYYVDDTKISQLGTTVNGDLKLGKKLKIAFETGAGSYRSQAYNSGLKDNAKSGIENVSTYKRDWDELLFTDVFLEDFPAHMQLYRVGEYYVNPSAAVTNTSVEQASTDESQTRSNTSCYPGLIPMIGQVTNNRQGINLLFSKAFGDLKTKAGYGFSQELRNLYGDTRNGTRSEDVAGTTDSAVAVSYTNAITFQHYLNSLERSRFSFWETNTGPYSRISNSYRRSYESIVITDTVVDYKKVYTSVDLELKYKFVLFKRPMIVANYVQYNSVQDKVTPVPIFNDEAFIRYLFDEMTVMYNINHKVTLIGVVGYESVKGNDRTELADSTGALITDDDGSIIYRADGKPIDQTGYGVGYGIDYNISKKISIHFRHKWYKQEDENFTLDKFKGQEASVELKVFF